MDIIAMYLIGLFCYWVFFIENWKSPRDIVLSLILGISWPIVMVLQTVDLWKFRSR